LARWKASRYADLEASHRTTADVGGART
jgi:hypothetical protein